MLKHSIRVSKALPIWRQAKSFNFVQCFSSKKYFDDDDKLHGITTLDRLLLIKPAISEEADEEYDGFEEDEQDLLDLDGDPDPRVRIGKKLLAMGKVSFRQFHKLPEWFVDKQKEICENRSSPQIRRCLKDWMIKYDREEAYRYLRKPLLFGDVVNSKSLRTPDRLYGPEETIAYSHYYMPNRFGITARLFSELKILAPEFQPKRIVDFGCGPATAAVAAYSVWGAEGTGKYTGIDMSTSMIDAAKIMTRDTITDCVFWDKSSEVIKRAETRNERFDLAVISYSLSEFVNDPIRRAAVQVMFELLDVGGYLVVLDNGDPKGSNMTRSARQLVLDLFNHVDETGKAENQVTSYYGLTEEELQAKKQAEEEERERKAAAGEYVSDKVKKEVKSKTKLIMPPPLGYSHSDLGAYVVAPCTHDKVCPLAEGTWCSFSQRVSTGLIRKGAEEKFSYVILQKRPRPLLAGAAKKADKFRKNDTYDKNKNKGKLPEPVVPELKAPESFGAWTATAALSDEDRNKLALAMSNGDEKPHPTPLNVLQRFVDVGPDDSVDVMDELIREVDWDHYNPPLFREEFGRILRSPIKNKGNVVVDLCHSSGSLHRHTLSRSNLLGVPQLYTALRKASWGGLFPVLGDDVSKSALAVKAKGNRGKQQQKQPKASKESTKAPAKKKTLEHEVVDLKPSRGRVLNRSPEQEEELERRELLKKMNSFTGRPADAKTFFPTVEPRESSSAKRKQRTIILPPKEEPTYHALNAHLAAEAAAAPKPGRRRDSSSLLGRLAAERKKRAAAGDGTKADDSN